MVVEWWIVWRHVGCSGEKGRERWVHEGNSGTLEAVGWVHVVKGPPPRSSHSPVAATVVRVDDVVRGWHSLEWMEVVVEVVVGGVGT